MEKLEDEMKELVGREEVLWQQQAKALCFGGDRNSAFFHQRASERMVRNGIRRLKVEGVPWLLRPHSFQIAFQPKTLHADTKVATLFSVRGWNINLVRAEFKVMDANCILSIQLPSSQRQDEVVWHYNKVGKFSLWSIYKLACSLVTLVSSTMSMVGWNFISKSRVPPHIQLFEWRACNLALLTVLNLRTKGRVEGCHACGLAEDTMHVLLSCSFARMV
ncbi:hypothetical protein Salat_1904200 [Sesamum alatum]|uniref:Reverse transcriptase zinc-binding domain-containing protein n=1 Tax=Sesamum alatum TaxID=300844 RepID=A0AAE2CIH6_9LAMI|nr:hypothetical protein Salat_1904200 [Sesamum alatum]